MDLQSAIKKTQFEKKLKKEKIATTGHRNILRIMLMFLNQKI